MKGLSDSETGILALYAWLNAFTVGDWVMIGRWSMTTGVEKV